MHQLREETEMKSPIEILESQGIPMGSVTRAAVHIGATDFAESDYRKHLVELVGVDIVPFESVIVARLTYAYFTQSIMRAEGIIDVEDTYNAAVDAAEKHYTENNWMYASLENSSTEPQIDEEGNVKRKKGWKQVEAKKLYDQADDKSRKSMIAVFMDKLDMTSAGASTYFANCKKAAGI